MYQDMPGTNPGVETEVQRQCRELAAAIRLGCTMARKCTGGLLHWKNHKVVAACAIGAAMVAIDSLSAVNIGRSFPVLFRPYGGGGGDLYGAIADRNDSWAWTRERIADWIEHVAWKRLGDPTGAVH